MKIKVYMVYIIIYLTVELLASPPFVPQRHLFSVILAALVVALLIVRLASLASHDAAEGFLGYEFTKLPSDNFIQIGFEIYMNCKSTYVP